MLKRLYRRWLQLPQRLRRWRWLRKLIWWSRRHSLPGFFGVPIAVVLRFVYEESKTDLVTRANSMAFSFFLALFPSLIALLSIIPTLQRLLLPNGPDLVQTLQREALRVMPGSSGLALFDTIQELNDQSPTLFSLGTLFAFYFASNGIMAMMRGFDKSDQHNYRKRKYLRKRLVALLLTLQIGATLLLATALVVQLNLSIAYIADSLDLSGLPSFLLDLAGWCFVFFVFYGIVASLYRYVPATTLRTNWLSPGATFATLVAILISVGFTLYVNNFDTYNKIYGSIGAVIALLLWLQLNAYVLLVGYELNAAIAINRPGGQTHQSSSRATH